MKFLAQNALIIFLFVILIAIGVAMYGKQNKAKKEEEIRKINEILDREVGVDGIDIKSITLNTKTDSSFNAAPIAKAIYNAKGVFNDDEEAIYEAFAGKTKAQIKAIYETFLKTYRRDLDEFLKSILSIDTEYKNVISIVNQAA